MTRDRIRGDAKAEEALCRERAEKIREFDRVLARIEADVGHRLAGQAQVIVHAALIEEVTEALPGLDINDPWLVDVAATISRRPFGNDGQVS